MGFTDGINQGICGLGGSKVLADMVIVIGPVHTRKRYTSKMEYLCGIRDGSEKELGKGFWLGKCVAADIEHSRGILLFCEAWSQEDEGVKSENVELFRVIDACVCYVADYLTHKGGSFFRID